jgi:hypothetical protein
MGPNLSTGLQQLFATGATFSGLLRYMIARHPEERVTQGMARKYLMEAFAIPFHERIAMDIETPANDDLYAAVTAFLIPEIVSARPLWQQNPRSEASSESWLDRLQVTDAGELQQAIAGKPLPGISEAGWAALSGSDQERLRQMEVGSRILCERMAVLARLAEQLQRRICELEEKRS